jgi:hypothetical protein
VRHSKLVAYAFLAALVGGWLPMAAAAEPEPILQRAHAWARFGKGSWRQVRIVTESFDTQGNITDSSITDNRTTLEEVTPEHVSLKVEVTVEVGGKKFPSPPQLIQQGYAGESVGQTVSIKSLAAERLTVDGREIPCEAQQIEILGGANKQVIEISYSPRIVPTILRRKSTTSDVTSGKTLQEALTEVYALDKRLRVLDEPIEKRGYRVRQVLTTDRGSTTTWSVHAHDVPGEVVAESTQKFDDSGRVERRTRLELVGYGVEGDDDSYQDAPRRKRRNKRAR